MLKKLVAVMLFAVLAVLVYRFVQDPAAENVTLAIVVMTVAAVLILEIDRVLARPREDRRRAARESVANLGLMAGVFLAAYWIPYPWGFVFAAIVVAALLVRAFLVKRADSGSGAAPGARESG